MRGIHLGEFQELAPIGKRVEDKAIDMFHVSGGKIVEHWRDGDDPTDFLPRPGVPDLSENANSAKFVLLHRIGFLERVRGLERALGMRSGVDESRERTTVGTVVT